MKKGKFGVMCALLLLAPAIPMPGYAGSGGLKKWLHSKGSGSAPTRYRNDHIVIKHHATKHPKPQHASNSHS